MKHLRIINRMEEKTQQKIRFIFLQTFYPISYLPYFFSFVNSFKCFNGSINFIRYLLFLLWEQHLLCSVINLTMFGHPWSMVDLSVNHMNWTTILVIKVIGPEDLGYQLMLNVCLIDIPKSFHFPVIQSKCWSKKNETGIGSEKVTSATSHFTASFSQHFEKNYGWLYYFLN